MKSRRRSGQFVQKSTENEQERRRPDSQVRESQIGPRIQVSVEPLVEASQRKRPIPMHTRARPRLQNATFFQSPARAEEAVDRSSWWSIERPAGVGDVSRQDFRGIDFALSNGSLALTMAAAVGSRRTRISQQKIQSRCLSGPAPGTPQKRKSPMLAGPNSERPSRALAKRATRVQRFFETPLALPGFKTGRPGQVRTSQVTEVTF